MLRAADEVRNQAERLDDALATLEQRTRETIDIGRRTRKDQERRVGHLIDACQQRMQDDVIRIVGARQSWPQTVADFGPQVADQWDAEQAALVAEVDQALKERLADLAGAVKGAAIAAEREWTTAHPELEIEGLRDFRGLWKRKAAGVAVGAGGALAFALPGLLIAGPVGAIVGAVAGLAGQALVPRLRKKIQSLFKSRVTILEANRVLLQTEIGKILTELEARTLADVTRSVAAIRDATASTFALRAESEQASSSAADLLANQRGAVRSEISTLDLETARCILRADGRLRIAESIERVSRLPGICAAVELSSDGLAEAWLFPPTSPEIMTFGRESDPRLPGARASTYVLGLTEEVPAFLQCRFDRTVVTVDTAIPNQVLAAWSANLSDHLGTIVEMVSTQRSADA